MLSKPRGKGIRKRGRALRPRRAAVATRQATAATTTAKAPSTPAMPAANDPTALIFEQGSKIIISNLVRNTPLPAAPPPLPPPPLGVARTF
jgi:hypothetical protein